MNGSTVLNEKSVNATERKTKVIGNTTYNVGIAYSEEGETLDRLLLQIMKERCKDKQ